MTTLTVYHLGRSGEVSGGMTQVINDYLSWTFPLSTQRLIVTRAEGRLATIRLFLAARGAISRTARDSGAVVVAHLSQDGSFIREGMLAVRARKAGLPVVAQVHGSAFPRFARRHPRLARFVLGRCHIVHVLSEESAAAVRDLGITGEVVVIPNAVGESASGHKEKLVVFGGGVTRRKGVDSLLAAWRRVGHHPDWRLVVAGPHVEPDLVRELPSGAAAPGALPREELRALLASAAIAVLPSVDEGMPLFILEALASSAAVIATPVGGIPSVIDASSGVLVPVGDTGALATALSGLMADAPGRERISRAGHAVWRDRYSAAANIPQLEGVWTRALELRDASSAP